MTSPDGITWTSRTAAASNDWAGVVFGGGKYASVSTTGTGNRAMTMSPTVFFGGSTDNNHGTVTSSGSDPAQGGSTIVAQNYKTNNYFNKTTDISTSQYGVWDFDIDLSYATYESTYCFRATKTDGTVLTTYNAWPELTRCTVPPTSRRLRGAKAFCGNVNRFFWHQQPGNG
jgi:hypothetical protein